MPETTMNSHDNVIKRTFRRMRIMKINRELWIFILFVCVAVGFWFIQVLKDQTTLTVEYKLELKDVPGSAIITSNVPSSVSATLQGRGYSMLEYITKHKSQTLQVDYSDLPKVNGMLTIDYFVWKKVFSKELNQGVSLVNINPSNIEIYTSAGNHKQVPAIFNGQVKPQKQYLLCDIKMQPQYVDIYAPEGRFDTIKTVSTQPVTLNDIKDTTVVRLALKTANGVKCVPDSVTATICIDLYTTKTVKVPIYCENIPEDRILRTFPLMATVTFNVSATKYPTITSDDFVAIVDYATIKPDDRKCRLILKGHPEGVSNIKLSPEYLDYVIEQDE